MLRLPVATFSPAEEDILGDTSEPVQVAAVVAPVRSRCSPSLRLLQRWQPWALPKTSPRLSSSLEALLRTCANANPAASPFPKGASFALTARRRSHAKQPRRRSPRLFPLSATTMVAPSVSARTAKETPGNMPNFLSARSRRTLLAGEPQAHGDCGRAGLDRTFRRLTVPLGRRPCGRQTGSQARVRALIPQSEEHGHFLGA